MLFLESFLIVAIFCIWNVVTMCLLIYKCALQEDTWPQCLGFDLWTKPHKTAYERLRLRPLLQIVLCYFASWKVTWPLTSFYVHVIYLLTPSTYEHWLSFLHALIKSVKTQWNFISFQLKTQTQNQFMWTITLYIVTLHSTSRAGQVVRPVCCEKHAATSQALNGMNQYDAITVKMGLGMNPFYEL